MIAAVYALVFALAQVSAPATTEQPLEINTALMQSTFLLQGPSKVAPGKFSVGSGFVVGQPCGGAAPDRGAYTLVTAAHVLDEIAGEDLLILVRLKQPDGTWRPVKHFVKIREIDRDRWAKHPEADVAALYITLPDGAAPQLLPIGFFATDSILERFAGHPGDEVLALGFPFGVTANEPGFPLLRSGRIASYPLLPQAQTKTFMVDMDAFPGNSGSPVYFYDRNRFYEGGMHIGEVRFLMGIITGTVSAGDPEHTRLRIAEVVHANFVLDTIAKLPPPPCGR